MAGWVEEGTERDGMTIELAAADAVLDRIEERELVNLALHLASVESPAGEEGEAAEAIHGWLSDEGLAPRRLGIYEDRFNVFAELRGRRAGPSLARVYTLTALAVCAEV